MSETQSPYRILVWLALRDYVSDGITSVCHVLALGSVLVPLLILFGLKYGIIAGLLEPLLTDPRFRQVTPVASGRFDAAWFDAMAERDDVAFVLPRTRSIAATMALRRADTAVGRLIDVELIPTAAGDPALGGLPPVDASFDVVLSSSAADALGAEAGTPLIGIVRRTRNDRREVETIELVTAGVAPTAAFDRAGAFGTVELLAAIEDFRDGRTASVRPDAGSVSQREFAGFRLYAGALDQVDELRRTLARQGVDVRTHAADIDLVTRLDRNLAIVFWLIAGVAAAGYGLSFGSAVWANVERKVRDFSVLRLIGFKTRGIVMFPLVQALATSIVGWLVAVVVVLLAQGFINVLFSDTGDGAVCRLRVWHFLVAAVITVTVACSAALLGGVRVARLDTTPHLKEG